MTQDCQDNKLKWFLLKKNAQDDCVTVLNVYWLALSFEMVNTHLFIQMLCIHITSHMWVTISFSGKLANVMQKL